MEPQMNKDERRSISEAAWPRVGNMPNHIFPLILLFGSGCAQVEGAGQQVKQFWNFFTGNTPVNAAVQMENQVLPDQRRQGIAKLSDQPFGRRAPYTERYRQIAQLDNDWLVRATAIRALNRARDMSATPAFIRALADESPIVRTEAAKALANIPDNNAIPALLRVAANPEENRDVRIAAADALKHYRTIEVARALITLLNGRDFGVAWQAHRSLVAITGTDKRYDESAWLQYLSSSEQPFG
jgi:hypothetical protein